MRRGKKRGDLEKLDFFRQNGVSYSYTVLPLTEHRFPVIVIADGQFSNILK